MAIRGIYATALTRLLMDNGFRVVQPSTVVRHRIGLKFKFDPRSVFICDRKDRQAVKVQGSAPRVDEVLETFRRVLPDVIVRDKLQFDLDDTAGKFALTPGFTSFDVEFPGASKIFLDNVRNMVKPTLLGHHQLKVVNPRRVDEAEALINGSGETLSEISREVKEELIYARLVEGRKIGFEHVKPDGQFLNLRPGSIRSFKEGSLTLLRKGFKPGGSYDGVAVPREEGDYAVTEIVEGAWFMKHSYYNREGVLKCEYYNVNTPVEIYPSMVRYVDLEVDVVRRCERRFKIVDLVRLDSATTEEYISESLARKAKEIAEYIARGAIRENLGYEEQRRYWRFR